MEFGGLKVELLGHMCNRPYIFVFIFAYTQFISQLVPHKYWPIGIVSRQNIMDTLGVSRLEQHLGLLGHS